MQDFTPQKTVRRSSALGRARAWAVWQRLLVRARGQGIPSSELQRVRSYLGLGPEADRRPGLQRTDHYLPGLPSRPWYEEEEFEWTKGLREAFPEIRRELEAVRSATGFRRHATRLGKGGWSVFYLYYVGRKVEPNCLSCPVTTRLVESIPGHEVGLAYFSRLSPGGHIAPHCGPANTALRCHLALKVPGGCRIRVTDETREWEEGKCLVFDDSFEHEVWNRSQESRHILIVDFFHPHLTGAEKWAVSQIMAMSWLARWRFRRVTASGTLRVRDGTRPGRPLPPE